MYRYALASLFGLWLTGCAHFGGGASVPPSDAVSLANVAVCAAQSPLVAEVLVEGRPALDELKDAVSGAVERLKAGEQPTTAQLLKLQAMADALEDVRACL